MNITKFGITASLIPTSTSMEIYQYSDAMLKHLPEKALKELKKISSTAKKKLSLTARISTEVLMLAIHLLT